MEAFRTRKETIKATYTAAQAQTQISEAFTGISEEMGDVGLAIQRAEDKTANCRPALAPSTNCWPRGRWTTSAVRPATTSRRNSTAWPAPTRWSGSSKR